MIYTSIYHQCAMLIYVLNYICIIFIPDMSKPASCKVEPWTAFPKDAYSILKDDFVHEKLFTVKVSAIAPKGTINLKNQIVSTQQNLKSSGEIKVWFPVWKLGTLYFKSVNKQVKVHYDNGPTLFNDNILNWYGSFQASRVNNNSAIKLGAIYTTPKYDTDNRVRVTSGSTTSQVSTSHKLNFIKNKWSFSAFEVWNWTGAATIMHNGLRFGYKHDQKTSIFLRAEKNGARKFSQFKWGTPNEYFSSYMLNLVHKMNNDVTFASQIDFTNNTVGKVSALILKNIPERSVWIKLRGQKTSTSANLALAYQGLLKNYGKWIFGLEVSDIGNKNVVKYGAQIDINL